MGMSSSPPVRARLIALARSYRAGELKFASLERELLAIGERSGDDYGATLADIVAHSPSFDRVWPNDQGRGRREYVAEVEGWLDRLLADPTSAAH